MQAPRFSLKDQDNRTVTLDSFKGKKLLLYAYPKADTPGCTAQACGLRDNIGALKKAGVVVVGISPDEVADLKKFAQKYGLPFTLLADPDLIALKAYNVWGEKQFMGRRYMGVLRTTFLISETGAVLKRYDNVKPETHADTIIADIKALANTTTTTKATTQHGAKKNAARAASPSTKTTKKSVKKRVKARVAKKTSAKKRVARTSSSTSRKKK